MLNSPPQQAHSTDKKINDAAYGAFQLYSVLLERNTAPIPDDVSFESASVLPLGLATAAAGLFEKEQLGLQYPQRDTKPTGQTLLVWGGSTSVGCNAIQLAVAAGYEVFSTSSPHNFALLESLGATQVFNYKDPDVNSKIIKAMSGRTSAGAIAIRENSAFHCLSILGACEGKRHMAMATYPIPAQPKRFATLQILFSMIVSMVYITVTSKMRGIKTGFIWGSIAHSPVLSEAIYVKYLPEALANQRFRPMPEPYIVGKGLQTIQEAFRVQKKGVSGKKIVVSLE